MEQCYGCVHWPLKSECLAMKSYIFLIAQNIIFNFKWGSPTFKILKFQQM